MNVAVLGRGVDVPDSVILLVDGERLTCKLSQSGLARVDVEMLRKMSKAKKVEGQLGRAQFELAKTHQELIESFLRALEPELLSRTEVTMQPATQAATKPAATRPSADSLRKAAEQGNANAEKELKIIAQFSSPKHEKVRAWKDRDGAYYLWDGTVMWDDIRNGSWTRAVNIVQSPEDLLRKGTFGPYTELTLPELSEFLAKRPLPGEDAKRTGG